MQRILPSILCLALGVLPLGAQGVRGTGHLARALNLTPTQKTSIQAIREKHRPDLAQRRESAKLARVALRSALQDATTPEAKLRSLHEQASAAHFNLVLARRSMRQEVQAVLTPEQRLKAADLRAAAQLKRRERLQQQRLANGHGG